MEAYRCQDIRERPYYTAREVSQYTNIKLGSFRSWVYRYDGHIIRAHLKKDRVAFSFMNLVEAYVVGGLRAAGVSMQRILKALDYFAKAYPDIRHPLANYKCLSTDRKEVFWWETTGKCLSASESGQYYFPEIHDLFKGHFEVGPDNLPILFFPPQKGKVDKPKSQLCINPEILCGQPVIAGSRISARMIADLYRSGESLKDIMYDFDLTRTQVMDAISFFPERKAS